ncbi:MAG: hypothetical protein LBT55_00365 [Clostridiaceae bacterium]|jgi:hypothetical protein|nr:hypothetical protein [Clostridiaceae bacterium]
MMKARVVKIVLPIVIVAVLVAVGLGIYFGVVNKDKDLEVTYASFDKKSSISFGEIDGVKHEVSLTTNTLIITTKDSMAFISTYVLTHPAYYKTIRNTKGEMQYILINDGYAYYVYADKNIVYVKNAISIYYIYAFPFVAAEDIIISRGTNVIDYFELNNIAYSALTETLYSSYEDVKAFYEKLKPDYWICDDATKTIRVRSYQIRSWAESEEARFSEDYAVHMTFEEDRIVVYATNYEEVLWDE